MLALSTPRRFKAEQPALRGAMPASSTILFSRAVPALAGAAPHSQRE